MPECRSRFSRAGSYGFIYQITRDDGKFYIGQKSFGKGSDWTKYTGSSTDLNADIKKYGIHIFTFDMLFTMPDKANLNMAELYVQVHKDVITRYLDGECYNKTVIGKTFFGTSQYSKDSLEIINEYLQSED